MSFLLHGVHLPHRKNTADMEPVRMSAPSKIILPMSMHIGAPAIPCVKAGDHVDVGTPVGTPNGYVSSPIYSSVSGTVKKIEDILLSSGKPCPAVIIESDGLMTPDPNIVPPQVNCYDDFISAVRQSGVVGLGGAGFPTHVKLNVKDTSRIQELIINGAECEPYITSDTRTMIDKAHEIENAVSVFEKYLGIKKTIIGIEENKKKAIAKMQEISKRDPRVEVKILPSIYPQGGEKVLVYHTTGKVIPAGKLPLDVGCIVCNCTTMAAVSNFIKTGMPLVTKCITVEGSAVKEPKNVIAPIGTPISDVFEFCGGFSEEPHKILYGGPMMGISVPDTSLPVLKNTNALLAFGKKDAVRPRSTQCIHCGLCVSHCPVNLSPVGIARAYKSGDAEALLKLRVDICMECGCCSYVCPAKRPLVETNKMSKTLLREYMNAQKAKEGAK